MCLLTPSACSLSLTPPSLDFGTVAVGAPVTLTATLSNVGQATCTVTGISLGSSSDPAYALAANQARSIDIPVGGDAGVEVVCDPEDANSPSELLGEVDYWSNDPNRLMGTVPLTATL
jgi:hypothetical protein